MAKDLYLDQGGTVYRHEGELSGPRGAPILTFTTDATDAEREAVLGGLRAFLNPSNNLTPSDALTSHGAGDN